VRIDSPIGPEGFLVPVGAPEGFVEHAFRKSFVVPLPTGRVWRWLNDPATFVEGQVWPFRVEFVDGGFEPGVLNVHHGPGLNAAGVIGEVREPQPGEGVAGFRDLKYFYGSYAVSPRLFRPTRLRFWAEGSPDGAGTLVTVRLDALVRAPLVRVWAVSQGVFWARFPRWMERELSGGRD
jgi:hypothetical protein